MSKVFEYELRVKGSNEFLKTQATLELALKGTAAQLREAKKLGDVDLYGKLKQQQTELKTKLTEVNNTIKQQVKDFQTAKYPTDSLVALKNAYAKLRQEISQLSQEELKTPIGKKLIADAKGISDQINKTSKSFGDFHREVSTKGVEISKGFQSAFQFLSGAAIGAALGNLVVDSAKAIVSIEKLYFQIRNITDTTDKDIEYFKSKIPGLSNAIGISQEELLKGLYLINSAGLNGEKSFETLEVSAKLSAVGLGNVDTIARTLTGTINAYGKENLSVTKAAENLFKTVKLGSGDVDKIAGAFSNVTTIGSQLGINIDQLGTGIASLTNKGKGASEAITQIESILIALLKPTKQGTEALLKMDLSYEKLRDLAKTDLLGTLQLISDKFKGNDEAIADVFGRSEALQGFFTLTGKNATETQKILAGISSEFNEIDNVVEKFNETRASKLNRFFEIIKNGAISVLGKLAEPFVDTIDLIDRIIAKFKAVDGYKGSTLNDTLNKQRSLFGSPQSTGVKEFGSSFDAQKDAALNKKIELSEEEKLKISERAAAKKKKLQDDLDKEHEASLKKQEQLDEDLEKIFGEIAQRREKDLRAARKAEEELFKPLDRVDQVSPFNNDKNTQNKVNKIAGPKVTDLFDLREANEAADKIKQLEEDLKDAGVEALRQLGDIGLNAIANNAIGSLEKKKEEIDKETELRISALESEYDIKKQFAQGNAELIEQLDKEQAAKSEKILKEQGKKQQEIAIKRAKIEGAVAIAKTFATYGFPLGIPFAAAQLAAILIQIAEIKKNGFAFGGEYKVHSGPGHVSGPGTATSDSINAKLSNGEYVLSVKMKEMLGIEWLERLRAASLGSSSILPLSRGKYASGGPFTTVGQNFIPNLQLAPISSDKPTSISNDSIQLLTEHLGVVIERAIESSIPIGMDKGNRRLEREQSALANSKR